MTSDTNCIICRSDVLLEALSVLQDLSVYVLDLIADMSRLE
jgi:hypothetical protein